MRHRRIALGGVAVVVAAVIAVVVVIVVSDGDTPATSPGETGWDAVAVLDREAGEIVVVGDDGAEVDRFGAGVGESAALAGSRGRFVIVHEVSGDAPESAIVDTSTGEVTWSRSHDHMQASWLPGTTSPVAMFSDPAGAQEAFVIDAATGTEIDIVAAAGVPEAWIGQGSGRASPDGRVAAVVDGASDGLATAVVDLDEQEALTVTGRFLGFAGYGQDALGFIGATEDGDDRVVLVARSGDELGSMAVPDVVGGAVLDSRTAVVTTAGGELLRVDIDEDEPVELVDFGEDGGPATVQALPGAERLVVTRSTGMRLLTTDGDELAEIDGTRMFTPMNERTACLHVVDDDDVAHLIDVETGDDLATTDHLDAPDIRPSDDGCTVTYRSSDGAVVLERSGVVELDGREIVDVAPDGSAVLVGGGRETIRMIELPDGPETEPLDLGVDGVSAAFVTG